MASLDRSRASAKHRSLSAMAVRLNSRLREEIAVLGVPLFVGLDGRSGVGKSTLAAEIAGSSEVVGTDDGAVTVIDGDDFYSGGSAESWDHQTPSEKAARVIDWRRQRAVLRQLRERGIASWRPFDWEAEDWDRDVVPLASQPVRSRAGSVVLLEGAYSCRPELHDLLDLRVLVDVPREVRRERLLAREGDAYRSDWEARWSEAEDYYFGTVMPPDGFDLVLRSG